MALRKKTVIKIMDERLAELGFSFDQSVSEAGMWGFARIVDTSWCFDYPSESNRAVERIFIDKDPYENKLRLVFSVRSIEGVGAGSLERMDKLVSDKYGDYCVPYESEKEKNTSNQMSGLVVCSEEKRLHKESFEDAVRILRDIAVDYGLDIMKDWEKNAHGGPTKEEMEEFSRKHKELGLEFEEKYLTGIKVEDRIEKIQELLSAGRGKRYAEIKDILNGAMAYIGDRLIEVYDAEWVTYGIVQKTIARFDHETVFVMRDVHRMWLDEDYPQKEIDGYRKLLTGEAVFNCEMCCVVRPC